MRIVNPGDVVIAEKGESLATIVGSCVAVCIYCERLKVGGMNHFLLPQEEAGSSLSPNQYGVHAIPALVREFKRLGCRPDELVVKIIGGGQGEDLARVGAGERNIRMAQEALKKFGLKIHAESLGGDFGRRVEFQTGTGRVRIRKVVKQPKAKTKLLIIEDSLPIQKMLVRMLESDSEIEIVGVASDTRQADELRRKYRPDVITLDLHLPDEDGVSYLRRYMGKDPVPTLVVTSFNIKYSEPVFQALEAGAFDCVEKPTVQGRDEFQQALINKIHAAAKADVNNLSGKLKLPSVGERAQFSNLAVQSGLIAIGSSTGGTEALKVLLADYPNQIPPVLIVQHMPPVFTQRFAERLAQVSPFAVCEAEDGQKISPNCVYIAPGGRHMKVKQDGAKLRIQITDDPPVNLFRPSVDYLFDSLTQLKGVGISAMILTGMGGDGANGLLRLRKAGANTIAQDESTSVVFGMPKVAIDLGAAESVLPIQQMASRSVSDLNKKVLEKLSKRKVG